MLKKFICVLLASVLVLTGCGFTSSDTSKINIVCTAFPVYDWTKNIVGDNNNINITYLLDNGADMHNFQPTVDDMIKISDCDIFIYIGGESDSWVRDAIYNAQNKNMTIIKLINTVSDSLVEEELKEGMSPEKEDEDKEKDAEENTENLENEETEVEYDEHIWLSLENAEQCVTRIYREICNADMKNSEFYKENYENYITELDNLNKDFHTLFDDNNQTLIFGDRFPFRYFIEDYNLEYYAAFKGCSADTDASFETITFLAKKVDELNADTVFAIENSDCTIAEAIIENTQDKSQTIAVLDSAQSVTNQQIENGTTYLSIMQKNYNILREIFE